MRRVEGYTPKPHYQARIEAFEEAACEPFRRLMIRWAQEGRSARSIAETVGVPDGVIERYRRAYGITATGSNRLIRKDGSMSVRGKLLKDGYNDAFIDRVYRRLNAGMSFDEAVASAKKPQQGYSLQEIKK